MIFETLTLVDFGVFKGLQQFDLVPRIKYGVRRPIVLFGGLNGSGKTSMLMAIRLALHGRQALGFGTSQKKYETLLARLFHRDGGSRATAEKMSITLHFTYSSLGGATRYTVERAWKKGKRDISEHFSLLADGKAIESADPEQAQAFLTQLIPVGVADLFFFDGEKIAELATEDGGEMLAESVQRLLGLDIVLKLKSDLDVYGRRQGRRRAHTGKDASDIESLFLEIERTKSEVDAKYHKIRQEIEPAIQTIRIDLDKLEGRLAERGGAWAVSRDAFQQKLNQLLEKKELLEAKVRELASDLLPLALAPSIVVDLITQLESECDRGANLNLRHALEQRRSTLEEKLRAAGLGRNIDAVINTVVGMFEDTSSGELKGLHCLGESDRGKLLSDLAVKLPATKDAARALKGDLAALDEELAFVSGRISAAPSEEQLKDDFDMLKQANQSLGDLLAQKRLLLEEVRVLVWRQIELVRRVKKNYAHSLSDDSTQQVSRRVTAIKGTLDAFSERLVARKTALLAETFLESFRRLIRKSALISSAEIDPKTLTLKLVGMRGEEIQKSQLSAGERQLFAVAMLDALAKTSGRAIPIIIDTPLGRLDSRHRSNLVKHYLPHASHQVVVLSTDTEVDEKFFSELGSSISHAYHLDFDEAAGATTASEGYFWRRKERGIQHAA